MKNTIDNKARFFAMYYGQNVMGSIYNRDLVDPAWGIKGMVSQDWPQIDINYLELTPLSDISDYDAKGVFNYLGIIEKEAGFDTTPEAIKKSILEYDIYGIIEFDFYSRFLDVCDYLRSKGYALPWLGISVEEQIEFGWVKLKTKSNG